MFLHFTEDSYEKALIGLFQEMGYEYAYGPDIERDYHEPYYKEQMLASLPQVNPGKHRNAIAEAIKKVTSIDTGDICQRNSVFMDYLQNGVEVTFHDGKETRNDIIYLVDYDNIHKNTFQIINQWTYVEKSEKRADLIVFINGLPLVVIGLKSPSREETDASAAYRQLRNYMHEIPSLFTYNAFCVMSDMMCSKAGTITSSEDRFME